MGNKSIRLGDNFPPIYTMRECPSYPGYRVTKGGVVFSFRKRKGCGRDHGGTVVIQDVPVRQMGQYVGHGDYLYVSVSTSRGQRSIPIHTLLLDAFIGPRSSNVETRHLDGDPRNNMLSNLCYGTRAENAADRLVHGRQRGREVFNDADICNIRKVWQNGESVAAIANQYAVGETTVRDVLKGKTYSHVN